MRGHINSPTTLKVPGRHERPGAPSRQIHDIITAIQEEFRVAPAELFSGCRRARVAWARQVAMSVAYEIGQDSKADLSRLFHRDHSTVSHAIRTVRDRVETERKAAAQVEAIRRAVK